MSGAMKTEKAAEQDSRAYEVVEEIFLLGTALQARYRPLGAGVQEDDEVSGCCGDLPQVHPEPRHVSEERRDALKFAEASAAVRNRVQMAYIKGDTHNMASSSNDHTLPSS